MCSQQKEGHKCHLGTSHCHFLRFDISSYLDRLLKQYELDDEYRLQHARGCFSPIYSLIKYEVIKAWDARSGLSRKIYIYLPWLILFLSISIFLVFFIMILLIFFLSMNIIFFPSLFFYIKNCNSFF
jgi:hypothetical protein